MTIPRAARGIQNALAGCRPLPPHINTYQPYVNGSVDAHRMAQPAMGPGTAQPGNRLRSHRMAWPTHWVWGLGESAENRRCTDRASSCSPQSNSPTLVA